MRRATLLLLAALLPVPALAAPPDTAGAGITRDAFVQRAAAAAGRRFDAIDTAHAGTITRAQMHAWRLAHRAAHPPAAADE